MTRTPLILSLVAAAALAGCNKENHTIVAGGEPAGDDLNAAANADVQLPPSIVASKIYRCADNAIVYVDYLSDNKSANIRTDKAGSPTQVTAAEAGKPMSAAGGYSLEGSATSGSAKIGIPGHPSQSCKA
jgi:hypothetical protein